MAEPVYKLLFSLKFVSYILLLTVFTPLLQLIDLTVFKITIKDNLLIDQYFEGFELKIVHSNETEIFNNFKTEINNGIISQSARYSWFKSNHAFGIRNKITFTQYGAYCDFSDSKHYEDTIKFEKPESKNRENTQDILQKCLSKNTSYVFQYLYMNLYGFLEVEELQHIEDTWNHLKDKIEPKTFGLKTSKIFESILASLDGIVEKMRISATLNLVFLTIVCFYDAFDDLHFYLFDRYYLGNVVRSVILYSSFIIFYGSIIFLNLKNQHLANMINDSVLVNSVKVSFDWVAFSLTFTSILLFIRILKDIVAYNS